MRRYSNLNSKRKIDRSEMARQLQHAVDLLVPRVKGTALDIGCGDGSMTEIIAKNTPDARLVAIDIAHKLTHQGKEGKDPSVTNIEYIVADASYLPFRDEAFDLVFALAIQHHVVALERCVNDIARVCKDEMVILEPNKLSYQSLFLGSRAPFKFVWRGGLDLHERPLSPLFIKSILKRGRFKDVDIKARAIFALHSFLQVAQCSRRYLRHILAPSNTGSPAPVMLFGLQFIEFNAISCKGKYVCQCGGIAPAYYIHRDKHV